MNRSIVFLMCTIFSVWPRYGWGEEPAAVPDVGSIQVLDLATAQQIALAANPSMEVALARVEQARAKVQQAGAAWWPSLDLSGSGGRTRQAESTWEMSQALATFSGQDTDRTTSQYGATLQASWLLFDGYYRRFSEEQARLGEKSAASARDDAQRLLAAAVAEAFFNAQLAQTNVAIATADRDFYSRQLQDAQNRFDAGSGSWGDVLNIRVQRNSAQTDFLLAGREFEAAGYGLAALLGFADARLPSHLSLRPLAEDADVTVAVAAPERLIEDALARRPDVRRLVLQVKQAEAGMGMAEAQFYPQLQLTGAVNQAREGDFRLSRDDVGNLVALNLSWNLYAGGLDRARRFEADQVRREADAALLDLKAQVAAEIRQDVALLEAAREQVLLQRESTSLVQENRDLASSEYESGLAPLLRLNEAQRDLTATLGRLALAQVAWQRAWQRLLAATASNVPEAEGR